jgi:hypothetical protein
MAKKNIKKETPLKLNMTFEEAMKKALNTPLPQKQPKIVKKNNKK